MFPDTVSGIIMAFVLFTVVKAMSQNSDDNSSNEIMILHQLLFYVGIFMNSLNNSHILRLTIIPNVKITHYYICKHIPPPYYNYYILQEYNISHTLRY